MVANEAVTKKKQKEVHEFFLHKSGPQSDLCL